jgi:hypothetical protein
MPRWQTGSKAKAQRIGLHKQTTKLFATPLIEEAYKTPLCSFRLRQRISTRFTPVNKIFRTAFPRVYLDNSVPRPYRLRQSEDSRR